MKKFLYRYYRKFKKKNFTIIVSVVSVARIILFKKLLDNTRSLSGDIVECGVGASRTFQQLAILLQLLEPKRKLWGFDSFEGFPEPSTRDWSIRNVQKGERKDMTVAQVLETLRTVGVHPETLKRVILIKGFFSNTLPQTKIEKIVLLHLDVDLYESYKICLEQLYPKVVEGGVIIFDEYIDDIKKWPGASRAIDEFFGEQKKFIQKDAMTGKYYFIKRNKRNTVLSRA